MYLHFHAELQSTFLSAAAVTYQTCAPAGLQPLQCDLGEVKKKGSQTAHLAA